MGRLVVGLGGEQQRVVADGVHDALENVLGNVRGKGQVFPGNGGMASHDDDLVPVSRQIAVEVDCDLIAGVVVDDIPGLLQGRRRALDEGRVGLPRAQLVDDGGLGDGGRA